MPWKKTEKIFKVSHRTKNFAVLIKYQVSSRLSLTLYPFFCEKLIVGIKASRPALLADGLISAFAESSGLLVGLRTQRDEQVEENIQVICHTPVFTPSVEQKRGVMNCWKFYKHVDVPLQLQVFSCCCYYWGIVAPQVVLGSAVQGNRSAICIHISPLSWSSLRTHPPSHPSRPSQSTDLSSLGYIAASPLAVCFTYGSAHKSVPVSQFIPPPPCFHTSILYIFVSVLALQIDSSAPFF